MEILFYFVILFYVLLKTSALGVTVYWCFIVVTLTMITISDYSLIVLQSKCNILNRVEFSKLHSFFNGIFKLCFFLTFQIPCFLAFI